MEGKKPSKIMRIFKSFSLFPIYFGKRVYKTLKNRFSLFLSGVILGFTLKPFVLGGVGLFHEPAKMKPEHKKTEIFSVMDSRKEVLQFQRKLRNEISVLPLGTLFHFRKAGKKLEKIKETAKEALRVLPHAKLKKAQKMRLKVFFLRILYARGFLEWKNLQNEIKGD